MERSKLTVKRKLDGTEILSTPRGDQQRRQRTRFRTARKSGV